MSPATRLLAALALVAAGLSAGPAQALEPFVANYQVLRGGRTLGEATMQVVRGDAGRWRVDLGMRGTGLIGLAGINAEQSTAFDQVGETYRPLTQGTLRRTLFTRKQTTGTYDWRLLRARWTGDVKATRRAPVALQAGDMSGLLINLALVRDAAPGRQLNYRFVDGGRVRDHAYLVAGAPERVDLGELSYQALRVSRTNGGNDETILWVASGVPTPVRILQRTDGEDAIDLRLVEYRGTP